MILRSVIRCLGALFLLAGLTACSSGGTSTGERLGPLAEQLLFGESIFSDPEPAPKPPVFTRAELNQVPFATIAVKDPDGNRAFVVPLADNGGHLVYQDALRRGIIMFGGLVTATQGLPYNLSAVRFAVEDPVARPTPVAEWPGRVFRNYQFVGSGGVRDYQITTSCSYEVIARERIEIIELFFDTVRVAETCSNTARSFTNTYWADPATGFIWRSEQWVGPRQDPMNIEIIRPYSTG